MVRVLLFTMLQCQGATRTPRLISYQNITNLKYLSVSTTGTKSQESSPSRPTSASRSTLGLTRLQGVLCGQLWCLHPHPGPTLFPWWGRASLNTTSQRCQTRVSRDWAVVMVARSLETFVLFFYHGKSRRY